MLVLAFDTSTPAVTVAVVDVTSEATPQLRAERTEVVSNRHGELLAPLITGVLDDAGVSPDELAALAVGVGPGPFTGLRVGIVTAKVMSHALGPPAYGACSLDAVAPGVDRAVVTDARRKEVYWAVYRDGRRVAGPHVARPELVAEELRANGVRTVYGAGAHLYRDLFADFGVEDEPRYPSAAALGALAADRVVRRAAADILVPLYLRRPDAVEPTSAKRVST